MKRSGHVLAVGAFVVGVVSLTLPSHPAQAEMYVAGQIGATIPNNSTNIEGTDANNGLKFSDISHHDAFMYGAKLGYYFESLKWLGVETEVFNTNPNIKQQSVTVSGPGGSATGTVTGQDLRVLNWSPITVVVRYQAGQFEPYAGVGMGVYFSRIHDAQSGESSSDTSVGLNTQLGARYLVTKNVSVFGEWKYNRTHFNFGSSSPTQATGGLKGDYSANLFAFGVGYHF
jgi:opacity protein-like surface antigen